MVRIRTVGSAGTDVWESRTHSAKISVYVHEPSLEL